MSIPKLKPGELLELIGELYRIKQPLFIWGPPGIGKSSIVAQAAFRLGIQCRDLRLTLLEPVDLRGLPRFADEGVIWIPPAFLPREGEGILFLDELNIADPAVQKAAYQLILDRRLGEYQLPQGWMVIAAGNREEDRAQIYSMPAPLANRFVHAELVVSVEDWLEWASQSGIHPAIIGFIRFRPALLFKFEQDQKCFPTPRSWEMASRILWETNDPSHVGIAVGEPAATEFQGFWKLTQQLDPLSYLKDPDQPLPREISQLYALAAGVAEHLILDPDPVKISNLVKLAFRMPAEIAMLAISMCKPIKHQLMSAPEFMELLRSRAKYILGS